MFRKPYTLFSVLSKLADNTESLFHECERDCG